MAVAALLAACGESSSDSDEQAGTYRLEVTDASFPSEQRLGQTTLLRLSLRNAGEETVPSATVTFHVAGREGEDSALPFGVHDPQAGLAMADRPVWILAERYPRLAGSSRPAGAGTSNRRTFAFGPLQPGRTVTALWKLSAVRAGDWKVVYGVGAGLGAQVKAETPEGGAPGGTLPAKITAELPETEVTDDGRVVEIQSGGGRGDG